MSDSRVVVTIVTRSHLPYARALALSLAGTNPGISLLVLLVDARASSVAPSEPFKVIDLDQLPDQPTIRQMSFYYTPFELCNALKGHLSQYVFEQMAAEEWLYLDSDMMVIASLDPLWQLLTAGPIVITPHITRPIPQSAVNPYELMVIKHGIYNGGLMALKRSPATGEFLRWFTNRLSRFAFYDDAAGTFVDQTWLTLIPCLFEATIICRHPGVNIGHWNLHERELTVAEQGVVLSNGLPIICVHFSGWDFSRPEKVSHYAPAYLDPPPAGWAALGRRYRDLLVRAEYLPGLNKPYGLARFDDGRDITPRMRKGYLSDAAAGLGPMDPFGSAEHFYAKYPPRFYGVRRLLPTGVEKFLRSVTKR